MNFADDGWSAAEGAVPERSPLETGWYTKENIKEETRRKEAKLGWKLLALLKQYNLMLSERLKYAAGW